MNKKTACVTGASGMIGSRIFELLIAQGYRVRVLSRQNGFALENAEVFQGDIEDSDILEEFIQGAQLIFHCAGELKDESKMWRVNVLATKRLLELSEAAGVEYFCYLSSAGVTGGTRLKWVDESSPCNPRNTYEKSKWAAERFAARGIKGCRTVILRPTNVVDERKPGILALPQRAAWGDICKIFVVGGECAHIVHAEDVAEAATHFISRPPDAAPQCYIVSCDDEPLNTPAGLWALYDACRAGNPEAAIRPRSHLPLLVPHLLRRITRGACNRGDVRYSSGKLLETGFVFKLGVKNTVLRAARSRA